MGAALTYARRYALFALVGIAGEDDLDAPDILIEPSSANLGPDDQIQGPETSRKSPNGSTHKPRELKPVLATEPSATLRDELIREINDLKDGDDLALWARRRLPAKNTLTADDARAVEAAYRKILNVSERESLPGDPAQQPPDDLDQSLLKVAAPLDADPDPNRLRPMTAAEPENPGPAIKNPAAAPNQERTNGQEVFPLRKSLRKRNKAHLAFVASQPCLICRRTPCDAHHLKFAQPRSLGLKVSDEFTVPLCREHHQQLHRQGNEIAWWANTHVTPITVAKALWDRSSL
jgi:hypothetical protein